MAPSAAEGTSQGRGATASRPWGRLGAFFHKYWYAYAMVTPVVVVVGVIVLIPLIQNVYFSFTDINESTIANPVLDRPARYHSVGLDNYANVLSGSSAFGSFYDILIRTLLWTFGSVVFHYLFGLGLAVLLNRRVKGRGLYRVLLILPWAVPAYISAFAWLYLFNGDYGLINAGLRGLGVQDPPTWLGQSNLALFAVILVNIWLGVPFTMVALLGGMQSIPADLYEAAEIDGATPWQRFVNVTLPGLRSVSATVILLGVIWTFNVFSVIYLITGTNNPNTRILITYAFERFFSGASRDYAIAATYGVLILSMLLVFTSIYLRVLRRQGEEAW
jgi:arabinogalactan oligomer/maltooligosaccharide transport system permease protein